MLRSLAALMLIPVLPALADPSRLLDLVLHQPVEALKNGTAYVGDGPDFAFAIDAPAAPSIVIDGAAPGQMNSATGAHLWTATASLSTGTVHSFHYLLADGTRFGGNADIPAYLPESYEQPGIPRGALSEKLLHRSRVYPGMETNYWIYVPAQYDPQIPAALMVWQDGEGHIRRDGSSRTLNVIDNLIHEKKIPVAIQVFVSPGVVGETKMRSVEYDSVNGDYGRFLRDEILADVEKRYNLRQDSYSRAIAGNSSGGICAFNTAWFYPELFSRVLSRIGSFTSIQWHPDTLDGGNVYPFKVRLEAKRNLRVWLQDGANDIENEHGSWPLQNIQMANSLRMQGYDFHFSFGPGSHNGAHGNAEAPLELAWLWRGYDPARTSQTYVPDPSEANQPLLRVRIANRPFDRAPDSTHDLEWRSEALSQPAVPPGRLTEKRVHLSRVYPGMRSDYWVYVPAGYDPATPAPLMVWQDGEVNVEREARSHTLNVIDNLTAAKRIPVIVHLFLSPGVVGETKMRSIEYDTVDGAYARFLRDEILPEISREFKLRPDAYSRAIIGESSGGICAFNAAWFHPELFARVVSRIGSYASLQWHPGVFEGGDTYPFRVRKEPKRNIRVWLQDGSDDLENEWGSWPLQNLQMANSLKLREYDFHLSFGTGKHTRADGQMEAGAELEWIWRGYDPSRTSQQFEMEPSERAQPLFRVQITNR